MRRILVFSLFVFLVPFLQACDEDVILVDVDEPEEISSTNDAIEDEELEQGENDTEVDSDTLSRSRSLTSASGSCRRKVAGPPLGIACLQCGHPQAREQALQIAQLLAESCREEIATTILIDGTFSDDRSFLQDFIELSTSSGSRLHLYLYLSNGPWQRRHASMPDKGIGTDMSPEEFRDRIHWDESLQQEYLDRLLWAEPLFRTAEEQGAKIYLLPMLEDNLDQSSARKLEEVVRAGLPFSPQISLGRNPCQSCYDGNDASVPASLFLDQHAHSPHQQIKKSNGLVTNDGKTFHFSHESPSSKSLSISELKSLISRAHAQNNAFVIWNGKYQGIDGSGLKEPDNRNYVIPSGEDEVELLNLLRSFS